MSLLPGDDAESVVIRVFELTRMSECWSCDALTTSGLWFSGRREVPVCELCLSAFKVSICQGTVTAHARRTDPDTSKQAAASVNVTKGQEQTLDVIRRAFPISTFTLDDLVAAAAVLLDAGTWSPSGIRSRCAELVAHGRVLQLGTTRLATGRSARLHRLVTS